MSGLRREELALLAGISADYYLRLERGRDRNPSVQVLHSLARVLRLDGVATAHLLTLGSPGPTQFAASGEPVTVPAPIGQLLRAVSLLAFGEDNHFEVLESNAAARALSPAIAPGRNRLLTTFLDPDERSLFLNWTVIAAELVAGFLSSLAHAAGDGRTAELVAELRPGVESSAQRPAQSRITSYPATPDPCVR